MKLDDLLEEISGMQGVGAGRQHAAQDPRVATQAAAATGYEIKKDGNNYIVTSQSLPQPKAFDAKGFGQWLMSIFKTPGKAQAIMKALITNPALLVKQDGTPDIATTGEVNAVPGNE